MKTFDKEDLKKLYKPAWDSSGEDNGQITIIGGSSLFHGAPILALKTASRIVDMVFFASPEPSLKAVVNNLKANLSSFIWVPWSEVDAYIEKSDAVLIGPGLMRYSHETLSTDHNSHLDDEAGKLTCGITKRLLTKFSHKKWVIDAGSLQTMEPDWIPENAILTPNRKEFETIFKVKGQDPPSHKASEGQGGKNVKEMAEKFKCVIVSKGPETIVAQPASSMTKSLRAESPNDCVLIKGGNPGLTKGGSGDVLAGLTTALLAKNDPFLAACSASYILKAAADELYKKVGVNYNSDDLADKIPEVFRKLISQ